MDKKRHHAPDADNKRYTPTPRLTNDANNYASESRFASAIITLKIGPDERILTAHKDILSSVKFLAARLKPGQSIETTPDTI